MVTIIYVPRIPGCSALMVFVGSLLGACSLDGQYVSPEVVPILAIDESRDAGAEAAVVADDVACRVIPGKSRRDEVCDRWRCEARRGTFAARWSGDVVGCSAGDLDAAAGERALRLINLHRFLVDLPPVAAESEWEGAAQRCALVAHANARLSHTPGLEWRCWSDVAAKASAVSLIANRSVPIAIAAFIEDPGNEETMVHRRWLLSPDLRRVGLGSTDQYSCVVVDGRTLENSSTADAGPSIRSMSQSWVAWPPAGPVPIDVFESERIDAGGWTVQSETPNLDHATVTVSIGTALAETTGRRLPIRVTHLEAQRGSRSAIRFVPDGWSTEVGKTYTVRLAHASEQDTVFTVEPIDCSK